ncbi:Uncharacterised protein [Serratia quinivorans]|uniref:GAP1-N1 domain-containing protein n=1 Tax=Serratia quinivorans TaxID=137545 RepID=UPI00217CBAF5|nr:hypothetical protein [Serratia quinivorans]CAI1532527.1 Uncharacterised protein [Serratia quinivorans]CAI1725998.1 Uncharacterised protein [Serratia quinivorans]
MAMIDDKFIKIEQCLFGYSDGHRLLSSSIILGDRISNELLRKSDTPFGNITSSNKFHYSGFPIISEKLYALVKTWPAPEMNRPGCVWSQVLLIKFSDFDKIDNLSVLDFLFKRPSNNFNNYANSIELSLNETIVVHRPLQSEKLHEILNAIYSPQESNRIIYTYSPGDYIDEIYSIWSLQWPKLRRSLSFLVASSSTGNIKDLLKRNDIVFFTDERMEGNAPPYSEWQYILFHWMEHEPEALREYLWSLGKVINGGRAKFPLMVELFDNISSHDISKLTYSAVLNTLKKLDRIVKGEHEVKYSLEEIYKLRAVYTYDSQCLIYYAAAILETYSYAESIIPRDIRNNLVHKLSLPYDENLDLDCLLQNPMVANAQSLIKKVIDYTPLDRLLLDIYSLRSLDRICEIKNDLISKDYIYYLSSHFVIYLAKKYWAVLPYNLKLTLIKKTCQTKSFELLNYFNKVGKVDALMMMVVDEYFFSLDLDTKIKSKLTCFLIENLALAQKQTSNYNVLNRLLCEFDFNHYIINIIPESIIEESMTYHINDLGFNDKFKFYSFVYYKTYNNTNSNILHLLFYSFIQLHNMLSENEYSLQGWEILEPILPEVSYFKSWDKCYILRKSLVKLCKRNNDALNNLRLLLKDSESLRDFLKGDGIINEYDLL